MIASNILSSLYDPMYVILFIYKHYSEKGVYKLPKTAKKEYIIQKMLRTDICFSKVTSSYESLRIWMSFTYLAIPITQFAFFPNSADLFTTLCKWKSILVPVRKMNQTLTNNYCNEIRPV